MSKELYFTDGNNEVKYLDTTASFNLAITQDGSAFDLTNATAIDVKVANDTGYVFTKSIDMATIKQPLAGLITMPVDAEVMNALVPDDYTIEVWVTLSSLITPGSQEGLTDTGSTTNTTTSSTTNATTYNAIFPSDDPQGFTITENVMSDSGDVIPVMSLDDFQQEFDQLKTDLTNQVSTLQGPKGETGEGLEIKGKVDTTSQLPATASEGAGYLVNEELYVYTSGAWKDCGSIQGPQGIPGKTGTGVSSTTIQYQISNSATTTPTGTWSNSLIATTQVNPFLWTQATLNYDDGTSKSFYLVSSKGDKGDKGDTGDIGPVGPVGPVGAGLVVKGTVSNASQLPTTGNQEGYCYFVGTDLYVFDAGAWKNCGNVSPDLSNYVTVTDLNNGLSTKVTDNGNGTIAVNGSNVTPADISEVKGIETAGENLILNSGYPTGVEHWNIFNDNGHCFYVTPVPQYHGGTDKVFQINNTTNAGMLARSNRFKVERNTTYTFDMLAESWDTISSMQVYLLGRKNSETADFTVTNLLIYPMTPGSNGFQHVRTTFNSGAIDEAYLRIDHNGSKTNGTRSDLYFTEVQIRKSSVYVPWSPAPQDITNRVLDNHDGSIQVNGNTITPADDSTVLHNNALNQILTDNSGIIIGNDKDFGFIKRQGYKGGLAIGANNTFHFMATSDPTLSNTSQYHDIWNIRWDGKVSILSGAYFTPADDSKVAHLSGAEEISGQKTFDVAPIDKTTGNPYITKDGVPAVPSTLADTTKLSNFTAGLQSNGTAVATKSDVTTAVSTATANMVDSTKATNFTAGLQSGGVDVATAADLKSIEDSAWRQLDNKYITFSDGSPIQGTCVIYRLDTLNKRLIFIFTMNSSVTTDTTVKVDFSSVVSNISAPSTPSFVNNFVQNNKVSNIAVIGNSLNFVMTGGNGYASSMYSKYSVNGATKYDYCFVNYDELV